MKAGRILKFGNGESIERSNDLEGDLFVCCGYLDVISLGSMGHCIIKDIDDK